MMLRGTLNGFTICGPKVDRTIYLPDERETLAALAHRVGVSYDAINRANHIALTWRHVPGHCHLNRLLEPALAEAKFSRVQLKRVGISAPALELRYGTASAAPG